MISDGGWGMSNPTVTGSAISPIVLRIDRRLMAAWLEFGISANSVAHHKGSCKPILRAIPGVQHAPPLAPVGDSSQTQRHRRKKFWDGP
jgi:hypothetical protein